MNKEKIFAFWKDRAQKANKNGTNLRDDPTLKEIDIALIQTAFARTGNRH